MEVALWATQVSWTRRNGLSSALQVTGKVWVARLISSGMLIAHLLCAVCRCWESMRGQRGSAIREGPSCPR